MLVNSCSTELTLIHVSSELACSQIYNITLTVPCGSTFRPVCNLIQGIHELFYIITLSAKVLCLMTTLSDVERALYNSVISLLLRKPHTKELVEKT